MADEKAIGNKILLMGEINKITSQMACKQILELNEEKAEKNIQLIISSCGGCVPDGFSIIDLMKWSALPVYTVGLGQIASMGLMIFIAGKKGNRTISKTTSILCHQATWGNWGKSSELIANRVEEDLLAKRLLKHVIENSKVKTEKELKKYLFKDTDTWLTPEQAIEFGLADKIIG